MINSIQTVIDDMNNVSEGRPHGVPWVWGKGAFPYVENWNNAVNANGTMDAITMWGQVYEALEGNPATNTLVELRNARSAVLSKTTGKWTLIQSGIPTGLAFIEDFSNNTNKTVPTKVTADNTLIVPAGQGYNFHFWPKVNQQPITAADFAAFWSCVDARLVVADATKPDDRDFARYVLNVGGDYKMTSTGSRGYGLGMPKWKFVTKEWRSFNFCTLTPLSDIWTKPPPL